MHKFTYRTVFLSDIHLGFAGVNAAELSAFLKHLRCGRLYLVGDILDLWSLKSRWRWPVMHNQVVRRILKLAKQGTVVTYIPGNHDESLRQYVGLDLGGVKIAKRAVHRTADQKTLLVTHGDEYDMVVQSSPLLTLMGTWAYDYLIGLNRRVNWVRGLVGMKRWSFSHAIKARVKSACTFISNFEQVLLAEAQRRGFDGVVCGHIHQPELRHVTHEGWTGVYANCGDWLERSTALVEHADGRLEIIDVEKLLADAGIEIKRLSEDPVPLEFPGAEESVDESGDKSGEESGAGAPEADEAVESRGYAA
ncbi:MAG: UDP-2,3-diacylglucosamine diphosphatase [Burkholderiales bacterium]|nr:UDP-2,3-diacylglucosamine diphosphatase [Phycisphaerae bacterium]